MKIFLSLVQLYFITMLLLACSASLSISSKDIVPETKFKPGFEFVIPCKSHPEGHKNIIQDSYLVRFYGVEQDGLYIGDIDEPFIRAVLSKIKNNKPVNAFPVNSEPPRCR